MQLSISVGVGTVMAMAGAAATVDAATLSWTPGTPGIAVEAKALRQTVAGVTVRVRGYVAEDQGSTVRVFGPFPTSRGERGLRVLGIDPRNLGPAGGEGLGLLAQPIAGIATAGSDLGPGVVAPGFNNKFYLSGDRTARKIDFAVFEFSRPVTVNGVTVDQVSNADRDAWLAAGSTAPIFAKGLANALGAFRVKNSPDVQGGAFFTHRLRARNVRYLMVGARPNGFAIGPVTGDHPSLGGDAFFIQSVVFTP
ncbi:MAG: hypothetical protein AB7I59_09890 [Geminicoccaceae bacterium]